MIEPSELANVEFTDTYVTGEMKEASPNLPYVKAGTYIGMFDGVTTFLRFLQEKHPNPHRHYNSSTNKGHGDFNAFNTYEEAMDTFINNPSKVTNYKPKDLFITDVIERGKQVDYDVTGDFIDMGRHLEGVPEEFGSLYDGTVRNRRCTIVINVTNSAGISHQDINHRGARILRMVDALEATQIRTAIRAVESTECAHQDIILKRHDMPLSITDLAVVSHPEFLRRASFRFTEWSKTCGYGYGDGRVFNQTIDKKPELLADDNNDELVVWVEGNMRGQANIDKAFDKAEKMLQVELAKDIPEVNVMTIKTDNIEVYGDGDMGQVRAGLEAGAKEAE